MLRTCAIVFALALGSFAATVHSQTPEITVAARSAPELAVVLNSFGQRGEMFGLTGPAAFLTTYGRLLNDQQPITAALTFTTKTPMFAAELSTKDATAFFKSLGEDGYNFDATTGELTKTGSSMRFFVRQNGNQLRIADNADFLKNVRWPAAESFTSNTCVIARIDWRNLQSEMRSSVAQQALTLFLPQTNPMASFSIDGLPEWISNAAGNRVAGLFTKSETMALQFSLQDSGRVSVTADVVNRAVAGKTAVPSPLSTITSEHQVAGCEWNTPIESELRTLTQAFASQLVGLSKQMFAGDEIGDTAGLKVLHDGAAILARHCAETIALANLQGSLVTIADGTHPIIVGGIRVANPARLDNELQKLVKSAIDNGAPFQFSANVASANDLSVHRVQMPIAAELTSLRDLFGETLTIHLATSSHALLFGFGNGSDKYLAQLVSPQTGSSNRWFDIAAGQQNVELCTKLGLKPCQLRVVPSNQGFQVIATLPESKGPTQLTSTKAQP